MDVAVCWLHRDLRLHDNPALTAALLTAKHVVVTYIWSPQEEGQFQPGRSSRWWLYHSLQSLDRQLRDRGNQICFREGENAVDQLLQVCKEAGSRCVFFNNVYDPLSLVRDHEVKQRLQAAGVVARSFNAELLREPWEIYDEHSMPHTTFAAFWDTLIKGMPNPPVMPQCGEPAVCPKLEGTGLYRFSLDDLKLESEDELDCNVHLSELWKPGTAGALELLVKFLETSLPKFDHHRAKVDRDSTSKLSPHIHFGEISVRVIYHEVKMREAALLAADPKTTAAKDFLQQLGYREYSRYLSFHFPFTHERSLLEHIRACPYNFCPMRFKAWRQGMTGYPLVDAAMRQLWSTGWMHNRSRVFAAGFLVKNLLLPWQWGLKHFWDTLLDADLECDALGWQYVAGCLHDAPPFVYMPDYTEEAHRFDPTGSFVRRWVPCLAKLPVKYIHQPWTAPRSVLDASGVTLGEDYPMRIVNLSESRAALDHAWSVIQKCQIVSASKGVEPYNPPTHVSDMSVLEPEVEVESVRKAVSVNGPGPERSGAAERSVGQGSAAKATPAVSARGDRGAASVGRASAGSASCQHPRAHPLGLEHPLVDSIVASLAANPTISCGSCGPNVIEQECQRAWQAQLHRSDASQAQAPAQPGATSDPAGPGFSLSDPSPEASTSQRGPHQLCRAQPAVSCSGAAPRPQQQQQQQSSRKRAREPTASPPPTSASAQQHAHARTANPAPAEPDSAPAAAASPMTATASTPAAGAPARTTAGTTAQGPPAPPSGSCTEAAPGPAPHVAAPPHSPARCAGSHDPAAAVEATQQAQEAGAGVRAENQGVTRVASSQGQCEQVTAADPAALVTAADHCQMGSAFDDVTAAHEPSSSAHRHVSPNASSQCAGPELQARIAKARELSPPHGQPSAFSHPSSHLNSSNATAVRHPQEDT